MKLLTFFTDSGSAHTGALLASGDVLDFDSLAADLPARTGPFSWLDMDGEHYASASKLVRTVESDAARADVLRTAGALRSKDELCVVAPVPRPGKFICIGLNYRDHAEESGMDIPTRPLVFSKWSSCVVGPNAEVRLPRDSSEVDYEAEFGVVIGRTADNVSEADALNYVLGYTNINDVSARDYQFADGQWQRGKSCDTFAPMGEYIATTDELPEPETLRIRLRLNGETLQDSNTAQLIFGVAQLVSALSRDFVLEPGDVIATGTPPGVGFARKPPIWIQPGDVMEVEIDGLGILRSPVVATD